MKAGDFFKEKERAASSALTPKGYFIIRLDGKAFHTYTKGLVKPFDEGLSKAMVETTQALCKEVQNVKLAYTQSDEISLVLSDLGDEKTQLWFEGKIQKMVSVASSIATAVFNKKFNHPKGTLALFDARVFKLDSQQEVYEYLNWRRKDAYKNAITLISLKHFSHKEIHGVHTDDKILRIKEKGDCPDNYELGLRIGFVVKKHLVMVPAKNHKTGAEEIAERTSWIPEPFEDTKVEV